MTREVGVCMFLTYPIRDDFEGVYIFTGQNTWKYKARKLVFLGEEVKRRKVVRSVDYGCQSVDDTFWSRAQEPLVDTCLGAKNA
ncbi:hypothetical protein AVEN_75836-1 [Araneus ventricosus]|uniref:Uncharacterized protein n=1 Tax=Araneus ventricosus TaxID=182803 RepID=A0A4Y2JLW4_ARAVE|nr:hypothetical protein AVEN_75836-1 [Araneus ventricosus]